MMIEMKMSENSMMNAVFIFLGAFYGYASSLITSFTGSTEINVLIFAILLVAAKTALEKTKKTQKPWKWWLSNGIFLSIVVWIVVWTVFYNL